MDRSEKEEEEKRRRRIRCSDSSIRIYAFNANHILINADRCFLRREKNTEKRDEKEWRGMDGGSEAERTERGRGEWNVSVCLSRTTP